MSFLMTLFLMLFLHIFADFNLQGIMASMKQKAWWEKECEEKLIRYSKSKYNGDHYIALLCHSFEWAFVVMMPFFIKCFMKDDTTMRFVYTCFLIFNTLIHFYVDNEKANRDSINLTQDQSCHLVQVLGTAIVCYYI